MVYVLRLAANELSLLKKYNKNNNKADDFRLLSMYYMECGENPTLAKQIYTLNLEWKKAYKYLHGLLQRKGDGDREMMY